MAYNIVVAPYFLAAMIVKGYRQLMCAAAAAALIVANWFLVCRPRGWRRRRRQVQRDKVRRHSKAAALCLHRDHRLLRTHHTPCRWPRACREYGRPARLLARARARLCWTEAQDHQRRRRPKGPGSRRNLLALAPRTWGRQRPPPTGRRAAHRCRSSSRRPPRRP